MILNYSLTIVWWQLADSFASALLQLFSKTSWFLEKAPKPWVLWALGHVFYIFGRRLTSWSIHLILDKKQSNPGHIVLCSWQCFLIWRRLTRWSRLLWSRTWRSGRTRMRTRLETTSWSLLKMSTGEKMVSIQVRKNFQTVQCQSDTEWF